MDHHHLHENGQLEDQEPVSTREKFGKLLEYWIKHNEEHARAYLEWSKWAGEEELEGVASLLEEAAEMTISINQKLEEALKRSS